MTPSPDNPPPSRRGERVAALAITAALLGVLAYSLVGSIRQLGAPFCGFAVMEGPLVTPFSSQDWTGPRAGIAPMDIVLSADGVPLQNVAQLRALVATKTPGEVIRYEVQRFGGGTAQVDVPVMTLGARDVWTYLFPIALTGIAYIVIALLVYIFLPGTLWGRTFFIGAALMGLTTALDYEFATAGALTRLWMLSGPIAVIAGGHLCFYYPERSPLLEKRPWLPWSVYPAPIFFAAAFQIFLARPQWMIYLIGAYANYVLLLLFAEGGVIFYTYWKSDSPLARQRVRLFLAPFLITGSVMLFGALAALVADLWIPIQYVAVISIVFPAVLAYGLVTNRLFEAEGWLRRTVGYVVFTSLIIFCYAALLVVLEDVLRARLSEYTVARRLPVISAVLVVLVLMPLWRRVQDAVDRIFYRRRVDLGRALTILSEQLSHTFNTDEIDAVLADGLSGALGAEYAAVFRNGAGRFPLRAERGRRPKPLGEELPRPLLNALGSESRVVVWGDRALGDEASQLMERAGLMALVPVRSADRPAVVLLLGRPKSGGTYPAAAFEFLTLLSTQAAVSYDNARLMEAEKDRERIIQQESLAALAQLVNGAAHELRNPLASAHSLLQSALESVEALDTELEQAEKQSAEKNGKVSEKLKPSSADVKEESPARAAAHEIRQALQIAQGQHSRISSIVRALHELSELSAQGKEAVPLDRVLDDALRAVRHKYEAREFQVVYERGSDLPRIRGSYAQLSQLLLNLLDNAVQSLPEKDGVLRLALTQSDGAVTFRCEDNGCGIPRHQLKEIFRPFFTTRPSTSGARGLGLYVSHEIVRTHGGVLTVEPSPKGGTLALVRLPVKGGEED